MISGGGTSLQEDERRHLLRGTPKVSHLHHFNKPHTWRFLKSRNHVTNLDSSFNHQLGRLYALAGQGSGEFRKEGGTGSQCEALCFGQNLCRI